MNYKQFIFLSLALVFLVSCDKDDDTNQVSTPAYSSADQYIADMDFVGAAYVRSGEDVLLDKGYGLANESTGMPNATDLVYRIGSVTKAFTAFAVVQLKRDGLIESFDQPISDFDDTFPQGDQITIRHLLRHHTGIPDYVGPVEDYVDATGSYVDRDEIMDAIVEAIEEDGLQFTPGEYFSYSNSNYFLLGTLVEELSGMSFDAYLHQHIFSELGMTDTRPGEDMITGINRAQGYDDAGQVEPYQMQIAFSAGYLESSVYDLERWGDGLMGDFLSADEKTDVFEQPYHEEGVATVGFGWFTGQMSGNLCYYHGGNIDGFSALIGLFPETNSLVILLSNRTDKTPQLDSILRAIAKNEF